MKNGIMMVTGFGKSEKNNKTFLPKLKMTNYSTIYFEKNIIRYENPVYKRAFNFVLQSSSRNFRLSSEESIRGFHYFFKIHVVSFYFSGYTAFKEIKKLNDKQYGRTSK